MSGKWRMEEHDEWIVEGGGVRNDRRGRGRVSSERWKELMLNGKWKWRQPRFD